MTGIYKDLDINKDVYPYLAYVMLFKTLIFVFETFLDCRQYSKFQDMKVPADIRGFVEQKLFEDSQSYNRDVKYFGICKNIVNYIVEMLCLYFMFTAYIWECGIFLSYLGLDPDSEVYRAYSLSIVTYLLSTITDLPWNYYKNFVINEKHGFNKMTLKIFFTDLVKSMIIFTILIAILIPILVKTIEYGGPNFYIYLFIFIVIFTFIMIWIVPNFIMPLFNNYTELEESELRTKIYELSGKLEFPLKKLFIVDASMRSTQSNAYFFGFGSNKRIVLYDNLKKHLETDEIVAVVAHELGHWKLNHTILHLVYSFTTIFLTFYVFSFVIERDDILIDFGFTRHYNIVSLMVFLEIYSPIQYLEKLIQTFYTRVLGMQGRFFTLS